MKSIIKSATVTSSLLLALTACGGNPPTTETENGNAAKASQEAEVSDDEIDDFFKAIAKSDTDSLRSAASELAASDSFAEGYATHLANVTEADLDAGYSTEPSEYKKSSDGYQSCSEDLEGEEVCTEYTDLETQGGKLASFSVNGTPLEERLTLGDGSSVNAGELAKVELLSAYKSGRGDLFVVMKIDSRGEEVSPYVNQATYRAPNGRQSTASSDSSYIDGLAPDSSATMYAIFPRAEVGGEVTLTVATTDTYEESTAKIKIK